MCISPDELTNEELESNIRDLRSLAERHPVHAEFYWRRIELYEEILKERAEVGTYVDH